jgi:hypothetical protein
MRAIPPLALLFLVSQPLIADDLADFASPPAVSWLRYDPLQPLGLGATFDFSGGQCRISAPAPSYSVAMTYGGARAGLFAPTGFETTAASVDVTDWYPTTSRDFDGTFIGVMSRVQSPVGPGNVNGYSASILDMGPNSGPGGVGRNGRLQIVRVINEGNFTQLGGYEDFLLDPTHDYRLVLVSRGEVHTACVYDLSNPCAPVATRTAQDSTFASGRSGVMILTDRLASVDATIDNFLTWDASPPQVFIQNRSVTGAIELRCDYLRYFGSFVQATTDLSGNTDTWQPLVPLSAVKSGDQMLAVFSAVYDRRFFRRCCYSTP